MQCKALLAVTVGVLLGINQAVAQIPRPPESIRIPVMAFDKHMPDKAKVLDEDLLPTDFRINGFTVSIGKTQLNEITEAFRTGIPLYNGKGYYQCYSLPKYSHQIWFITKGVELSAKVTGVAVRIGNSLPTEYCPLITSNSFPMFTNKLSLESNVEYLEPLLGKPLDRQRTTSVYLFQLPKLEKLKVQIDTGKRGVEIIKVMQQELL